MPFTIAGKPEYANPSLRPSADLQTVTPDYFRDLWNSNRKRTSVYRRMTMHRASEVAMVNEAFANRFLKGVDPLQQRVVMEQVIPGEPKWASD